MKKGQVKIVMVDSQNLMRQSRFVDIYDFGACIMTAQAYLLVEQRQDTNSEFTVYDKIDGNGTASTFVGLSVETDLESILNVHPNSTLSWVTPMTEVPSQGGGSGLTIEDVYPVGIEITTTDTTFNPMKVWGGTWTVSPAGAKRVWTRTA